ncbi:hypothetical protein DSECCO2_459760 [anaerobic digester metagenome]
MTEKWDMLCVLLSQALHDDPRDEDNHICRDLAMAAFGISIEDDLKIIILKR